MKNILTVGINVLLWWICWTMAWVACLRRGKVTWKLMKSTHGITLGYKQVFWDFLEDKITQKEHDTKLYMYYYEI